MRLRVTIFLLTLISTQALAQVTDMLTPLTINIYGQVSPGNIFITNDQGGSTGNYPNAAVILDSAGNYVFVMPRTTSSSAPYNLQKTANFLLQPDSTMSVNWASGGNPEFFFLASTFTVEDSIECNGWTTDPRDIIRTSDGHFHLVCQEQRTMDLSGLLTNGGQPGSTTATVIGNVIQELDATGAVLWEWFTIDNFSMADTDNSFWNNANTLDHAHVNSLAITPDGHYLISSRHLNEVTKISRTTGQIMWRLGGVGSDFTVIGDSVFFNGQHDARELANGHITVFDNSMNGGAELARAMVWELDTVAMTATIVRQYTNQFGLNAKNTGSAQLLDDDHFLIGWGGMQPVSSFITVQEVDENNALVMDIDLHDDKKTFRARKYELPFELPRPEITCDDVAMTLSAPGGYNYYEWTTGETTQSINISATGTYQVWVDHGLGYISSLEHVVTDLSNMCSGVGVEELSDLKFQVFPNPSKGDLTLKVGPGAIGKTLVLRNALGQEILRQIVLHTSQNISMNPLPKGVYLFQVGTTVKKIIRN